MAISGAVLDASLNPVFVRLWADYLTEIIKFEGGNIPYMYVDTPTARQITVGVGHNLTSHRQGAEFEGYLKKDQRFMVKRLNRTPVLGSDPGDGGHVKSITDATKDAKDNEIGRTATADEIQNDYDFLAKHTALGGATLANKRKYTTLELKDGAGEDLFKLDLSEAIKSAIATFGDAAFAGFPLPCQAAIIDIAYNPGLGDFPNLVKLVKGEGAYQGKPRASAGPLRPPRRCRSEPRPGQAELWTTETRRSPCGLRPAPPKPRPGKARPSKDARSKGHDRQAHPTCLLEMEKGPSDIGVPDRPSCVGPAR